MTFIDGIPVDDGATLRAAGHDLEASCAPACGPGSRARSSTGCSTATCTPATCSSRPTARSPSSTSASWAASTTHAAAVLRRALPAVLIDGDYRRGRARRVRARRRHPARRPRRRPPPTSRGCSSRSLDRPLGELSYGEVLGRRARASPPRYHVRLPRELVLVVKQLLYFERYAKELAPDYPLLADPPHPRARRRPRSRRRRAARACRPSPVARSTRRAGGGLVVDRGATPRSRGSTTATGPSYEALRQGQARRSGTPRPTSTGRSTSTRSTPAGWRRTCR